VSGGELCFELVSNLRFVVCYIVLSNSRMLITWNVKEMRGSPKSVPDEEQQEDECSCEVSRDEREQKSID
jgi:hypothetical protein